ncbi:MAG: metalloregulator ArsR/SmtB family transcription factor [Pseudomonadota bacterium]
MQFSAGLDQLRAAGEATRLRTLALLRQGDMTVTELTRVLEQSQPRVSRHLRVLVDAQVIEPYQEGSWRFYRLGTITPWLDDCLKGLTGPECDKDVAAFEAIRRERASKAASFFSENAPQWDALRQMHVDDDEIERALLALAPEACEHFLDLGTGTGRMLVLFAGRYRDALGVDMSAEMLAIARVRLEDEGIRNATIRRRDVMRPDELLEASSDLVCLHHVLHFLGEPERAIASAARALRPGGVALIADFAPHDREELRERYAHRRLGFGTQEIEGIADHVGLAVKAETTLDPGPNGNLISKVWRLEKPGASAKILKEEALV